MDNCAHANVIRFFAMGASLQYGEVSPDYWEKEICLDCGEVLYDERQEVMKKYAAVTFGELD